MSSSEKLILHEFDTAETMASALADRLCQCIQRGVNQRGIASLALAGGSTPIATYALLRERCRELGRTSVTPTDERWVTIEDSRSNAAMLKRELGKPWSVATLSDSTNFASPFHEGALRLAHEELAKMHERFDATLLGMGADGHFASIFPDDPGVKSHLTASQSVVPAAPASQPTTRVSLSPKTLFATDHLMLVICGDEKRQVLEKATASGPTIQLPISYALEHNDKIEVYYSP